MLKVSRGRYYENDTKMRNFIALRLLVLLRCKKVLEQEEHRQQCEGGNKKKPEREICGQYLGSRTDTLFPGFFAVLRAGAGCQSAPPRTGQASDEDCQDVVSPITNDSN